MERGFFLLLNGPHLTEVEDIIKGQDLQSIQSMMDVTKDTMAQHIVAYDKFKDQIDVINSQADAAISSLNFYEPPETKETRVLPKVNEEGSSDTSSDDGNLDSSSDEDQIARPVPKKRGKGSLEENKSSIVKTLMAMNTQMRTFSREVEKRLDNVYKQGAGKKYGYEGITQQSITTVATGSAESKYEDRMLAKMQNQAQQYLEANKAPKQLMIKADHSIGKPLRVKNQRSAH